MVVGKRQNRISRNGSGLFLCGNIKAAALQQKITALIYESLRTGSLYGTAKEILRLRGMDIGDVRAPFLSLGENEKRMAANILEKIQEIASQF